MLMNYRMKIGAVIRHDKRQDFPVGTVLPYRRLKDGEEIRSGGYGDVYQYEVAPGHLKNYEKVLDSILNIVEVAY